MLRLRPRVALVALSLLTGVAPAEAHAPPEATGVFFVPHGAVEQVVVRTNRGLIVSDDGTYRLLCNEALDVPVTEVAPLAFTSKGVALLATISSGVVAGSADMCRFHAVSGPIGGAPAFGLEPDPSAPGRFYAVTYTQGSRENVYVSADDGQSWKSLFSSDAVFTGVRIAPSNPARLYLMGSRFDDARQIVFFVGVSGDRGATFEERVVPVEETEIEPKLVAVDPADDERVYVRVISASVDVPERLLRTTDGGKTWSTVLTALDIEAVLPSPDKKTVYAASDDGVYRSTNHGDSFQLLPSTGITHVDCLSWHEGRLFACAAIGAKFGVSVSDDGGETFQPFLSFSQVTEPLACAAGTQGGELCKVPFRDWSLEMLGGLGTGGAGGTGAAAPDAGSGPIQRSPKGSGGCAVAFPSSGRGGPLAMALGMLLLFVGRRRRRRRAVLGALTCALTAGVVGSIRNPHPALTLATRNAGPSESPHTSVFTQP